MDYDMSRWVKPQNDQEGTVAKKIDAFFKANYSDKIIGDGEDYRVIVNIKPLSTDKQSASYLMDLVTILSSSKPDDAFRSAVNHQYVQAGQDACQHLITSALDAVGLYDVTDRKFAASYIKDIAIIQVPYQHAATECLLCRISLYGPCDLMANCTSYDQKRDPRVLHSEDLVNGEISLTAMEKTQEVDSDVTIYTDIPLKHIIPLKLAKESPAETIMIPAGSLIEAEAKYILERDMMVPVTNIREFSIGWM